MIVFVGHIDLHYFGLFVLIYFVAGSLLGMRPHFLWVLPKENGRARSKERRFQRKTGAVAPYLRKCESRARRYSLR